MPLTLEHTAFILMAQLGNAARGGQRDVASGRDYRGRNLRHRPYIQKSSDHYFNNKLTVKGSNVHATWSLHNGRTQIHIALANFKHADFDVVILPIRQERVGINVFSAEQSTMNYGTLFPGPFSPGEYITVNKIPPQNPFASRLITGGMFSDGVDATNIIRDMVQHIFKKKKRKQTMAIPVQFDGLYDPILFLHSIMEIRSADNSRAFSCFFCCKGHESDMVPFMDRINAVLRDTDMPRRYISPTFTVLDAFPALNVSTTIVTKGILNARCECIVAAIGSDFKLESKLTRAIVDADGSELQKDIDKIKQNYQYGDVIHCGSRKLIERGVKSILFGQLPKRIPRENDKDLIRVVSKFVKECILIADDNGCQSVVFPVLGSGYLSYPEDVIVSSLLNGIDMYASAGMHGRVTKVVIAHIEGAKSPLYQKFEMEIYNRRSMKERWKDAASADPKNTDNMNHMTNDEFKSKSGKEKGRSLDLKKEHKKALSGRIDDLPSADNTNAMPNDELESLFGEATSEVNSGITEHLICTKRVEYFRGFLSEQFEVHVDNMDGKLVLRGTLTTIKLAEDYLDNCIVNETMNSNVGTASLGEPISPSVNRDAPIENDQGEDPELITADAENTISNFEGHHQTVANDIFKRLYVPAGIVNSHFDIPECHKTLDLFKTNDLFSFQTDIKVVTFDLTVKNKNQYLSQVLARLPECKGIWEEENGKSHKEIHPVKLNKPNTCDYIFLTMVPLITEPIQKKQKQQFKDHIHYITTNILKKVVEMKVQSVTLPILVHTGGDAANAMCCQSMAMCILECLRTSSSLEHINVIFDSDSCRKIFYDAVKQKLHST